MSYNNDSDMRAEIFKEFMDHYFPEKEKAEPVYLPLSEKDAQKYIGLYENKRAFGTVLLLPTRMAHLWWKMQRLENKSCT